MTAMLRWITTIATIVLLSGCVYPQQVVYRDRPAQAPYYEGAYAGSPEYYREGDSYYAPTYGNRGDYYYGASYGGGYASYGVGYGYGSFGVSYIDYPVYYSLFWPLHRWYYDPFVYPGYRYGVTWFPRNYLSLSVTYGGGWGGYGWLSYSPYRNAWVDSYYDWGLWYNRYPSYRRYYPTPRYGDARVEASRLADLRRPALPRSGRSDPYRYNNEVRAGAATPAYRGNRAADYGRGNVTPRQSISADGVRRVNANSGRIAPQTGAFGNPTRAGTRTNQRLDSPRNSGVKGVRNTSPASQNELRRLSGQRGTLPQSTSPAPTTRERIQADQRGYPLPTTRTQSRPVLPATRAPATPRQSPDRSGVRPGSSTAPTPRFNSPRPATSIPDRGIPVSPRATPRPASSAPPSYRPATPVNRPAPAQVPRTAPTQGKPVPARSIQRPVPTAPAAAPPRSAPVQSDAPEPRRSSSSRSSSSRSDSSAVRRVGSSRDR